MQQRNLSRERSTISEEGTPLNCLPCSKLCVAISSQLVAVYALGDLLEHKVLTIVKQSPYNSSIYIQSLGGLNTYFLSTFQNSPVIIYRHRQNA